MSYQKIDFDGKFRDEYWNGKKNAIVRYWVYLNEGFELVNKAKNYFFIAFGLIFTSKIITIGDWQIPPEWIVIAAIIGFPFLVIAGRWSLYQVRKPQEYMIRHKTTITGYNDYNMQVEQLEEMQRLNKNLEELLRSKPKN